MTVDEGMVRAELERIVAPTMVVWGDQDRLIPRRLVDGLMELHPAWAFRAVNDIGHLLPLEAPQTVRRARCRLDGRPDPTRLGPHCARGRRVGPLMPVQGAIARGARAVEREQITRRSTLPHSRSGYSACAQILRSQLL